MAKPSRALGVYPFPQEHQQAVEEEFGPENFVVVVRGLLDEAGRWLILVVLPCFLFVGFSGWTGEPCFEWGKGMIFSTKG